MSGMTHHASRRWVSGSPVGEAWAAAVAKGRTPPEMTRAPGGGDLRFVYELDSRGAVLARAPDAHLRREQMHAARVGDERAGHDDVLAFDGAARLVVGQGLRRVPLHGKLRVA